MESISHDAAVNEVRQGNADAYGTIVEMFDSDVRMVLAAILPDRALVEDAAQETFVTAYFKLDEYEIGTDMRAWLKAIARNTARNMRNHWLRKQRVKKAYRAEIVDKLREAVDQRAASLDGDLSRALQDCMAYLKESALSVVRMHYQGGKTCAEIAAACKRTTASVKMTLYRARIALGRCLEDKGFMSHG